MPRPPRRRQSFRRRKENVSALNRLRRQNETEEEREVRLENLRSYMAVTRARDQPGELPVHHLHVASRTDFPENNIIQHFCGSLELRCTFCSAKHFPGEQLTNRLFTTCCNKGKVNLHPIRVSALLRSLMSGEHEYSKNFMDNIRSINSALAFASMGAKISTPPGHGPYCFRIHGQIYHRSGALHPDNDDRRQFAQLYVLDPDEASVERMQFEQNSKCNPNLMALLSSFMTNNNPFAQACKMLYEVEQECLIEAALQNIPLPRVSLAIVTDRNDDQRRYNAPRSNEVAFVFQNADGEPPLERDIIIHCRRNSQERKTERISILDPNLDAMIYPLLFPYGDQSWDPELTLNYNPTSINRIGRSSSTNPRTRVSQMQYYGHRFAIRDEFNPFLSAGKLTLQYFVDSYMKTEGNRLNFIRKNQSKLRIEKYSGLMDYLQSEARQQGLAPGQPIILPSSFQGSPRKMLQNYQDAMAIVRKFGKPDFFITMTCNPKWPEIVNNLLAGQSVEYRPDLVARVFRLKLDSLLEDIGKHHILGKPVAKIHVIEFQKRGLPHAHILLILVNDDKPNDSESVDSHISAEIPQLETHPRLHEIVIRHMIHGPCGESNVNSVCMVNGTCSKNFPKSFCEETIVNVDGYPKYRRRDNGVTAIINGREVDNSWVVPYNPYLCLKYNCHINVESCASIKSVKYLFKYVYKGHDCANISITEHGTVTHDEITSYMNSRYVSAPEAAWRLFGFNMHKQSHTIIRLQVHLPGDQSVVFTTENVETAAQNAALRETNLTAWFRLNQEDPSARHLLYTDIPEHYIFEDRTRKWKKRQRGGEKVIGRMYSVSLVSDIERFSLRLLLLHVPGATSFHDLRTVNGIPFQTFKEAAQKRGLLNDEQIWDMTLHDAVAEKMPQLLRELFAHMCIMVVPSNIPQLFQKYKEYFYEDYTWQFHHELNCQHCVNLALRDIQYVFISNGKHCKDFGLPVPSSDIEQIVDNVFDSVQQSSKARDMELTLNGHQREAFDEIIAAVGDENRTHRCYFLYGPGGSGKTYLYTTLLASIRGQLKICLATASTGIAANLLEGGRTYHSLFKLPVPILDTSTSRMRMTSSEADIIRRAKLIIWDESTMASNNALKCVNKLLQDIMSNENPFGGKTILLGGDFRQTLPVVPHGSRSAIVEASIKFNPLWSNFKILPLMNNIRSVDPEFTSWLMELGNGTLTNEHRFDEDVFEVPSHMVCTGSIVLEIFGQQLIPADVKQYANKAILCPKNADVDLINAEVLDLLQAEPVTYLSSDSIDDSSAEDDSIYPMEFLNELAPSGMPLHKLTLKVGAVIILLRNINTKQGLCNGTRLVVKALKQNLIIAQHLSASRAGRNVFIPRLDLAPTTTDFPFVLVRRQFPVKLAFAMTINKSQGQTLDKVGIYLPEPVFSHGQLYVAFSRVRRSSDIKVYVTDGPKQGLLLSNSSACFTKNVVYKEIFDI